jgi:hypothetical protein
MGYNTAQITTATTVEPITRQGLSPYRTTTFDAQLRTHLPHSPSSWR